MFLKSQGHRHHRDLLRVCNLERYIQGKGTIKPPFCVITKVDVGEIVDIYRRFLSIIIKEFTSYVCFINFVHLSFHFNMSGCILYNSVDPWFVRGNRIKFKMRSIFRFSFCMLVTPSLCRYSTLLVTSILQ